MGFDHTVSVADVSAYCSCLEAAQAGVLMLCLCEYTCPPQTWMIRDPLVCDLCTAHCYPMESAVFVSMLIVLGFVFAAHDYTWPEGISTRDYEALAKLADFGLAQVGWVSISINDNRLTSQLPTTHRCSLAKSLNACPQACC